MLTPVEIAAITTGLTELAKRYGIPDKFCPLVAIAIAVIFSLLTAWRAETDLFDAAISGLLTGLTTTGLYRASKEVLKSREDGKNL